MIKTSIQRRSAEILNEIIEIREHLHQFPELSFEEYETSRYVQSKLTEWGIKFTSGIAGTGIIVLVMYNAAAAMMGSMLGMAGVGIGAGAFFLAYCLFYKSSGGHFNPVVTASYWMGGKMEQEYYDETFRKK